jgi:hypothetical protein
MEPAQLVSRVLAKWRRFWGGSPLPLLTKQELIGLFAELWFLSVWLAPRVGWTEAVQRWRGPFGARHDFEWPGRSVEVKATSSRRGRIHHVNGLDQLEPPENGQLLLYSMQISEEAGAANTLPEIAARCRSLAAADALWQLEAALVEAGYSPTHDDEYDKVRMRVVEEALFSVRDDFPRILNATFTHGVPAGVERVEYEINLNGRESLIVATRSDQAFTL